MDTTAMRMDHRWGLRQATDVAVHVLAPAGRSGTGRVLNVSLTGAFLETSVTMSLYSVIDLRSRQQSIAADSAIHVAAIVVRYDIDGVGLEWCEALTKGAQVRALLALLKDGAMHGGICRVSAEHQGSVKVV